METIARKKNEPICKEALDYVRQHVYIAFSNEEFCIIEEYVVEKLYSLYPDGHLGDGDLRKYVCEKLTETNVLIPQSKVDIIIINIMYDIMLATDTLSLIATSFTLKTWYNWDSIMTDAIRVFKEKYACYPILVLLSAHTQSQIEFVTSISPKSQVYGDHVVEFLYSDVIENKVETCKIIFQIDNEVPDKYLVLLGIPINDDDNDDNNNDDPICRNTPVGAGSKQQSN